ncbi:MAG: hypothetical protein OXT06_11525 [Rhodospirillaceae bacterium]|nr:hypothetical protein [Rhodospirillaceae bacterium]MDD9914235.1 hypothetical protein [Rhodospirillaceae bacterium]MDD9924361.1 hypothetical protein [Rhodospirillaceae bacterium]
MAEIFSAEYQYLWAVVLAGALFLPVRRLIWVLMVRRATRSAEIDEKEQERLRRRASFTATLLCFIFSFLYTATLFDGRS